MDNFQEYMRRLEAEVMVTGASACRFGRVDPLPVRPGKLTKTRFGMVIGATFTSEVPLAVDYYGLLKRSTALLDQIEIVRQEVHGHQLKVLSSTVVHFASIRIEYIAELAPDLVAQFPVFKRYVLDLRGFKQRRNNG